MPHLLFILFFFALGACVGSFLNVVVWRLPRGESLITPPSHCPKCNKQLAWYDNTPVFGWIKLGGYLGLLTAIAAWYASFAGVIAFTWGRQVFPVGAPRE
jgi:leader peptidase (prepilin peptidase)/N-methyltransferase